MTLRYTLTNDIEGEHICTHSPKGWADTELVLKRHDQYDGIFKDYTVKVDFFCGAGKEYVDNIHDTQGVEADMSVMIEIDCDDTDNYETLYDGKAIMKSYEKIQAAPEYTRLNLEQSGIVQTVLNRLETKVNLSSLETLDGTALTAFTYGPYELTMHSKAIVSQGKWVISEGLEDFDYDTSNEHVIPLEINLEEIDTMEGASSYDVHDPVFSNVFSFSRTLEITGRLKISVLQSSLVTYGGGPPPPTLFNYSGGFKILAIVLDSGLAVSSTTVLHTEPVISTSVAQTFDFEISGTVTVPAGYYLEIAYLNQYELDLIAAGPGTPVITDRDQHYTYFTDVSYVQISEEGIEDDSTAQVFAVFETGSDIARKITDQADAFRSNYFGRKNSEPYAYDDNGCGSFRAITNGFQIRGFPIDEKPIYISMKEYFDGLNAIDCLGLGVKEEGGNAYIEIEPKNYFYTNEVLFSISNIKNLKTTINEKYFYNLLKVGYSTWRKEGQNGLDEFCTTHEYNALHKNISNTLNAVSSLIAAPYAIERQRRQQYLNSFTEDSDYDNNNFIICLNRETDANNVPSNLTEAEKNENFTNISNVYSPETIYNLRISPARNLRNWFKVFGTGLIKLNSILKDIKFGFAEGNYQMESEGTDDCDTGKMELIGEGDDVELTIPSAYDDYEPLFSGEIDDFEAPFSLGMYNELKELDADGKPNFYKQIAYSTGTEDYYGGYILELRYKPVKGTATFRMARAYEISENCSHIYVEEGYVECGYVE